MTGAVPIPLDAGSVLPAPVSGVQVGVGPQGPVRVRLLRTAGTRIVVAARALPAQLIALRAAAAGVPVHVATTRPQLWRPLLAPDGPHRVGAEDAGHDPGGPLLVVDDRPRERRTAADVRPGQCRVEVRGDWAPHELASFAHADLVLLGALPTDAAAAVASAFGVLPALTEPLRRLDGSSFAAVRHRRIEFLTVDPTQAEQRVLDAAGGAGWSEPVRNRRGSGCGEADGPVDAHDAEGEGDHRQHEQ